MNCFSFTLPQNHGRLEVYLRDNSYEFVEHKARPCVLICPGGGYEALSDGEAEPVALAFVQAGYQTAILRYGVRPSLAAPCLDHLPLLQCAEAVRHIRSHSQEWGIDPDKITLCGFSAGGHLAGSLGVFHDNRDRIPDSGVSCRPNAMVLCYPVITSGIYGHRDSFLHLAGPKQEAQDRWSLEAYVGSSTAPAFLWHTVEDTGVSVENAICMAEALKTHHVPFELHLYTHGPHGMSIWAKDAWGRPYPAATWFPLALSWLNAMGVGTGYDLPVSVLSS